MRETLPALLRTIRPYPEGSARIPVSTVAAAPFRRLAATSALIVAGRISTASPHNTTTSFTFADSSARPQRAASPVPSCRSWIAIFAPKDSAVSTSLSRPCPRTKTISDAPAERAAFATRQAIDRPATTWATLGSEDFILLPSPAASMTTPTVPIDTNPFPDARMVTPRGSGGTNPSLTGLAGERNRLGRRPKKRARRDRARSRRPPPQLRAVLFRWAEDRARTRTDGARERHPQDE